MNRANHLMELLDALHETEVIKGVVYLRIRSEINKMEKEFQEEGQKIHDQQTKYWCEVLEGKKPKLVTFDNGKTIYRLAAIKEETAPVDPVMFMEMGKSPKTW